MSTYRLASLRNEAVDRLNALSQQFYQVNNRLWDALGEPGKAALSPVVADAQVEFSNLPSEDLYGEILNEVRKLEAVAEKLADLDGSGISNLSDLTLQMRGWIEAIREAVADAQSQS